MSIHQGIHGLFTSESVCAGHPDKICDQISDAILDAVLAGDPYSHVAIETLVTKDHITLAGELRTTAPVDLKSVARSQVRRLGYTNPALDFTDNSPIDNFVHLQSPEIAVGVDQDGAGDQGMMFGYATSETQEFMPAAIAIAHRLAFRLDEVREQKILQYLRPDGKTQVTMHYVHGTPVDVKMVVIAVPHDEDVSLDQVKSDVFLHVVLPVLADFGYSIKLSQLLVNGTGVWHYSGPAADTGVTGRKIIVDSYGGYSRVGGGAFSGKDPTKVDRSGAYYARFIAKYLVANNLMKTAEVRLAYAIGAKTPISLEVEDFGTRIVPTKTIKDCMKKIGNKSVAEVIEYFNLRYTKYLPTASYGHFGRQEFPWEKCVALRR